MHGHHQPEAMDELSNNNFFFSYRGCTSPVCHPKHEQEVYGEVDVIFSFHTELRQIRGVGFLVFLKYYINILRSFLNLTFFH